MGEQTVNETGQTRDRGTLREGFTTGTAATAAACAALSLLLGMPCGSSIEVPLPPFPPEPGEPVRRLTVPVAGCAPAPDGLLVVGAVIKDGGDDPDATHGALIEAHVCLTPSGFSLDGGEGVGRVTLPGLPVPVGEAAINPQPRRQIEAGVREVCAACGYAGGVAVRIVVPDGVARAQRTMNGRLGILGGISILGTRGTVRPFSHSSWKATIAQGMDVARAAGCTAVGLSTGRRSERLLMGQYADWPELAFVQAADFVAFSLEQAVAKGFEQVAWACFFGKLVKLAQGHAYTHAQTVPIDFPLLSEWCREAGAPEAVLVSVAEANTARQVLEIIEPLPCLGDILEALTRRALCAARAWTGSGVAVTVHLFDFDGRQLCVVRDRSEHTVE